VKLGDLVARVPGAQLHGNPQLEVTSVTHDSRRSGPGSLFVGIRGLATDGNEFAEAARRKGALAICSEEPPRGEGAWVTVKNAREALALFSAAVLGDPARSLDLVGVTGTNGKTTTTYLIDSALRAAGESAGLVGTVEYRIGNRIAEAVRTTPESSDLQALLREMVDAGCRRAVLEVSSHSLALERVHGLEFQVAVFTNLTRDHLDFHGDMDAYFAAKRVLFERLLRPDGHAIVNIDDDRGAALARLSRGRVWSYSLENPKADLVAEELRLGLDRTRLRARTPAGTLEIESALVGRFNVQNLLETVRGLGPRRVITVFGCGGDRDRSKRPLMGAVAARLSDVVILTSDNPRSEPPEAILEEIRRGIPAARVQDTHVIPDRRDAIARALEMGREGVCVVIAGKGHETYQVLRERTVPFDDRQVARDVLARLAGAGGKR